MRLLHSRAGAGRRGPARESSSSDSRRRHARDEWQSLPVRDLSEHSIGDSVAGERQRVTGKGKKKPARKKPGRFAAPAAEEVQRSSRFPTTKVEAEGREETKILDLPPLDPQPWTETTPLSVVGTR